MNPTIKLTQPQAWNALAAHHQSVRELHLRQLFADDPKRGERMTAEAVGLYLDYSKNRITDEILKLLLQLADESGLRERIDAMFRGGFRLWEKPDQRRTSIPAKTRSPSPQRNKRSQR